MKLPRFIYTRALGRNINDISCLENGSDCDNADDGDVNADQED